LEELAENKDRIYSEALKKKSKELLDSANPTRSTLYDQDKLKAWALEILDKEGTTTEDRTKKLDKIYKHVDTYQYDNK